MQGARAVLQQRTKQPPGLKAWLEQLTSRTHHNVVGVALAVPLLAGSLEAISLIRERVAWCESKGVSILCCPEAILDGLADYSENPARFAITTDDGQLAEVLSPLASDTVTSIIGFTELADNDHLYNTAAVFCLGRVPSREQPRTLSLSRSFSFYLRQVAHELLHNLVGNIGCGTLVLCPFALLRR